ncbi:MAG: hypothetical protein AAGA80_02545 [Cyanobacteria bacterium P01_F01_bin.143]
MAVKTILYSCISVMKTIVSYLLAIALSIGLVSCGDLNISERIEAFPIPEIKGISFNNSSDRESILSETAPPILIRQLGRTFENYTPTVSILDPSPDQVLDNTNITVQIKVSNFPLFRDENLEIGPHLHLILDNKPYQAIYSVDEPIFLENLTPGTHTLRAFAVNSWNESFKNKGGYAETTFHILTKTKNNNPNPQIPLLTYNSPSGIYGAEPIMLDFYLSHLPSSEIVKDSAREALPNWRVKATVNGESFILDQWQPVYLTGFAIGNNWIQLELLDDEGNSIDNTFNNTVRLITYNPENKDSLSRIVTGEIDLSEAIPIVDQNYEIPVEEMIQAVVEEEIFTEEVKRENIVEQSELLSEEKTILDKLGEIEADISVENSLNEEQEKVTEEEFISETEVNPEAIIDQEIIQENDITNDNLAVDKEVDKKKKEVKINE